MSERANEERQDWTSDIVWVALYSILVLLLIVGWAYKPPACQRPRRVGKIAP
jgi:hypothetical protein